MLKRFVVVFLVITAGTGCSFGAGGDFVTIADLRDNWLVFDSESSSYIPFTGNSLEGTLTIGFSLNLERYKNYKLHINSPRGTSVFFNQQLISYHDRSGKTLLFDIDSVRQTYKDEKLWVALYNPYFGDGGQLQTLIVRAMSTAIINETSVAEPLRFTRRANSSFSDFFVTGVILLLILYALILNLFNKKLRGFYNIARALALNIREEVAFKGKIFDGANTPILLVHSFLISFIGYTVLRAMDNRVFVEAGFWTSLAYWGALAMAAFVLLIFKYWLLWLVGKLFKLPFINRHYLEYVRMSKIFFGLVFAVLIFLYLGTNLNVNNIVPIVVNIIIVFFFLRITLLYFKFIQSSSFNNLYLFSYLCSTEILPMVVGLKLLLK